MPNRSRAIGAISDASFTVFTDLGGLAMEQAFVALVEAALALWRPHWKHWIGMPPGRCPALAVPVAFTPSNQGLATPPQGIPLGSLALVRKLR
jgi:hypothetical protein